MPTMITLQEARRKRQKVAREAGVIPSTLDDFGVPDGATGAQATAIIRKKVGPRVWSKLLAMSSDLQRSNYLRGAPKSHKRPRPAHLRSVTSDEPEAPKPKKKKPLEPEPDPDAEPEEDDEEEEDDDMPTPSDEEAKKRKATIDRLMARSDVQDRAAWEASYDSLLGKKGAKTPRLSSDARRRRPRPRRPKGRKVTDRDRLAAAMKQPSVIKAASRPNGLDLESCARAYLDAGFDPFQ